jgi:Skp family chaperone for outer membrane proteins
MRVFAVATALSVMLAAAPTFAQAPAPTAPRPSVPVAPAGAPPAGAPAVPANVPFPAGVKYGFVNLEAVFADSAEGKRVQTLIQTRQTELGSKQKAMQDAQQKASQQASVMSDAAKAQAQAELEKQDKDLQRLLEDAQAEVQSAQQQAQAEWQRRINPVVQKLAQEKGLHLLLSVPDSGLVWADPSIDLTQELIDMQKTAPAPPPAAAAPGAPAAAPLARPATTPAPRPATPSTGK